MIFGAAVFSFGAQNVSFSMLVASNLTPWGIIERFRGTWEHEKGDLGVQVWISVDFGGIWGSSFSANFGTTYVFLFMLVSRALFY